MSHPSDQTNEIILHEIDEGLDHIEELILSLELPDDVVSRLARLAYEIYDEIGTAIDDFSEE